MEINVSKGLTLPTSSAALEGADASSTKLVAADLSFTNNPLRLLVKKEDHVKKGQALVQDKGCIKRLFPAPAAGKIIEIQRGLKRKLLRIVIEVDEKEDELSFAKIEIKSASKEQLLDRLLEMGAFFRLHSRPFDDLANPQKEPSHIFVKCLESAPLSLNLQQQLQGHEALFSNGLEALKKLCANVHLVCESGPLEKFDANIVTMKGKYPKSSLSIAIDKIAPITDVNTVIWTLNLYDVICIGSMLEGKLFVEKKVGLFQFDSDKNLIFQSREGVSFSSLIDEKSPDRVVSSHPLVGSEVGVNGFLGFEDFQFTILKNDEERPALHFMRPTHAHYSSLPIYAFSKNHFSTNLNGEIRAFIDGSIYQDVTPLDIPVMHLVQALMSKNYEKAIELGLLEVSAEDFALPSFIDPSKIDMMEIVKQGLIDCKMEMLE